MDKNSIRHISLNGKTEANGGMKMKRIWILFMAMALCIASLCGAEGLAVDTVTDGEGHTWQVDGKGWLVTDDPDAAWIMEDPDQGFWGYSSNNLSVRINQFNEEKLVGKKKRKLVYWVAEVYASPENPLTTIETEATKKHSKGYKLVNPLSIARKNHAVFAISDDLYGIRLQKYKYYGVVIRNGEVIAKKTRNSQKSRAWPNLDTLASYADGSMKAYVCDAKTPEEYLAEGAVDVFSFGPILVTDGEIYETVLNPKYYPYNEPRMAIGMVEPYHYVIVCVRGRPDNVYAGVHLDWLAEKMQSLGCVEALNLDGGGTICITFMGKVLNEQEKSVRSVGSLISFGTSDLVTE